MKYDFDTVIDRRGTSSVKYDLREKVFGREDVLPMWVADMDFRSPPEVLKAIVNRTEHGVFGYTLPPKKLNDRIVSMLEKTYDWAVDPEWLVWLPGVVYGLNVACRAIGRDGDDVMTAVPVYPPRRNRSLERIQSICRQARACGMRVRGYVSCVLGCPYEGEVAPEAVPEMVQEEAGEDCYSLSPVVCRFWRSTREG